MKPPFKKRKVEKPKAFKPGQSQEQGKTRQMIQKMRVKKHEKEKKAEEHQIHQARIRGAGKRKVLFWVAILAFIFIAVGIVNSYRHNGMIFHLQDQVKALSQHDDQDTMQRHPATGPGAQHFAQEFMKVYTNVKPGEDAQDDRQDELTKYMALGLDEDAGTDYDSLDGERIYKDSTVLDVVPAGKQTADVYVKVSYDYKYQKEETKKVKKKKKTKKKKQLVDHTKHDLVDYSVIRLYADHKGYAVVELPRPFVPDDRTTASVRDEGEGESTDDGITDDVRDFLGDFFHAYTSDDADNLKYYFVHASDARSIKGQNDFDDLEDVKVYDSSRKGKYRVHATVILKDDETGIVTHVPYALVLVKDKDKYQIQKLSSLHHNIN